MTTDLTGKVALITGGSQGIGKAIVGRFLEAGATAVVAALPTETLESSAAELESRGIRAYTFGIDLTDSDQAEDLVRRVQREIGPIDILVNNAGSTGPTGRAQDISLDDWRRTLEINLTTPFVLSRKVAPQMMERRAGKIINMSSIAGKMAYPLRTPYAASKWGLIGFTVSLAQELGPFNIQVNAICPGPTRTDMIERVIRARAEAAGVDLETMTGEYVRATALKRMVLPEEVADLALFLGSRASDAITGQAIDVSAGYGFRIGD